MLYEDSTMTDARLDALVRDVSEVISFLDTCGRIRYASPAAERAWGCLPGHLQGRSLLERVHPDDVDALHSLLAEIARRAGKSLRSRARMRHDNDGWRDFDITLSNRLDEPTVNGIVATYHDVTERTVFEHELSQLAFRDGLTGLANRTLFTQRLVQAQQRAQDQNTTMAVLFIDLDNFKLVNDSLGHAVTRRRSLTAQVSSVTDSGASAGRYSRLANGSQAR
jgi:PAS domain S-box-containing protein